VTNPVLLDIKGTVATVTLNRPEARNALDVATKQGLLDALRRCASDPQIRAVLLTGAGRAFSAGQDLREHAGDLTQPGAGSPLATMREHYNPIILTLAGMPKPVVAALPGVAAGAGASLAFACDFRLAASSATLLLAFARVGLTGDSGVSWTLPRLVGTGRAAELLMLAEPLPAGRALQLGLVTEVVDDGDLAAHAARFAARLASGPTAAYAAIKESLAFAAGHSLEQALDKETALQERLSQTEDHQAAVRAFLAKTAPVFSGR
jgi:2-(1,2-epoxy-1,2-dihydrophenyl)acetyl-CoA isomerase